MKTYLTPSALVITALISTGTYAQSFEFSSPDVSAAALIAAQHVLAGFGCTGGNISPALN